MDKFQKLRGVRELLDEIPQYFCGSLEKSREYLAFADLQPENYVLYEKSQPFDEKHLQVIFGTYGKFHALTFAYTAHNSGKYQQITATAVDATTAFLESISQEIMEAFQRALEYIKETHQPGADKVQRFVEDLDSSGLKGCVYEGPYSAWIHGDCWSNNMPGS